MIKTKVHKILSIVFKSIVLLLSLGYIYFKIFYNQDLDKILISLNNAYENSSFLLYLVLVLFLMPVNWGIETFKWRYLISKIENISFNDSIKAVLVGVTFSSFTPNRVGDYFGRAIMLKNADKRTGFLITIVGSIAQTVVTIFIGSIGLIWFKNIIIDTYANVANIWFYLSFLTLIMLNLFMLLFYFKISFLNNWLDKISFLKKIKPYFQILNNYSFKELLNVLALSLLRYIVFVFQFYVLLLMFNVHVAIIDGMALISVIYLITTIIPTIALTEIGVKSAAAIYFFEFYFNQVSVYSENIGLGVIAATFVLWIINLVLPALLGSFHVLKMKLFRNTVNE